MWAVSFLCLIGVLAAFAAKIDYPTPGATYEAKDFTTWLKRPAGKSRRSDIHIGFTAEDGSADAIDMMRLDLVGGPYDRGFGHGALLTKEIVEFTGPALDKFYASEVLNIDLSSFPEPLQSVLKVLQKMGAAAAPKFFKTAMAWVWEQEKEYVPSYYIEEINGMADGICSNLGTGCNATEWSEKIQELNMLPELIRMACTAYGAWGKATPSGKGLLQLRALDFGSGPWSNYTVIATHRNDPLHLDNAFVTVSFPAFVGVVTGVSQSGIGISEKVWMTYNKYSLMPGSYDGLADVLVLRDILQNTKTREEAEAYLRAVPRTWGIWIGIGDYASMKLDLVAYQQKQVDVYTDETAPAQTGQPYLEHVAYVDKHPQPSGEGPTGTLPTALGDFHGNITSETSKVVTLYHQTGDVHIATYDFENKHMYVAIGRVNEHGEYKPEGGSDGNVWKAYRRPYVKFNLNDLWTGI